MSFERKLHDALRRPEPPPGFAERVMARIAAGERTTAPSRGSALPSTRAAAAVLILFLGAGGWMGHQLEQRRRAEQAAEDAVAALRITSQKLNLALDNIERHSAE
jgi:hypothetical protein